MHIYGPTIKVFKHLQLIHKTESSRPPLKIFFSIIEKLECSPIYKFQSLYKSFVYSSDSRTVTPGLLYFRIFLRFFTNFRKNTPKNTTKTEKVPGLLHFFVTVRESLLYPKKRRHYRINYLR